MLHITNGDAAVEVMALAGLGGEMLPWRDVLHEGPVPEGLSLAQLSAVRAEFIADRGWGERDEVAKAFRERDATLAGFHDHEEVVLWFEQDLYDQLQLLQLLDWFSQQDTGGLALSMICVGEYLGPMRPEQIAALYPRREMVKPGQLDLAKIAWEAFRSSDPLRWEGLLAQDTSALPYLAHAVGRHLEQYPSLGNGANRTERSILDVVAAGVTSPARIFAATQDAEESRFMGDSTFWDYLGAMVESRPPLLQSRNGAPFRRPGDSPSSKGFEEQEIVITGTGRQVIANEADWIEINGIDAWLGGVHLRPGHLWRWDTERERLVRSST